MYEDRDVPGRGVVVGHRQAGGVLVPGIGKSKLISISIHHGNECILGTGDVFGQRHAGIVTGLNYHAFEQILDADFRSLLDKHA